LDGISADARPETTIASRVRAGQQVSDHSPGETIRVRLALDRRLPAEGGVIMAMNRKERIWGRAYWALPFALLLCALSFATSAPPALANHFFDATLVSWSPHGNAPRDGRTTFTAMQLQDGEKARFLARNQGTTWLFVKSTGKTVAVTRNAFFASARKDPAHFLLNGIRWAWRTSHGERVRLAQVVTGSYQNP
jgi:hypothetical protein